MKCNFPFVLTWFLFQLLVEVSAFEVNKLSQVETSLPIESWDLAKVEISRATTLESVASFDKTTLKTTVTEEKVILPDEQTISQVRKKSFEILRVSWNRSKIRGMIFYMTKINNKVINLISVSYIPMYWTNLWRPTVHVKQSIFEKKPLTEFGSSHLYASYGTFWVQIGQLFEAE